MPLYAVGTLRARMRRERRNTPTTKMTPRKNTSKVQVRKGKQPKKTQKKEIDCMISALQVPLPRHVPTLKSSLGHQETKELIKKHTAPIRARKARLLKKASQALLPQQYSQTDPLARAIDMAAILEDNAEVPQQPEQQADMTSDVLDIAIDNVLEALKTQSSSSSSDESSSSSASSSDSSDSAQWGTVRTYIPNPS